MPLDWATTLSNEGITLRMIAERRQDLALADRAVQNLMAARKAFEAGGHAPYANRCAQQAELALALIVGLEIGVQLGTT